MRWTRWVAGSSLLVAVVGAGLAASCASNAKPPEMTHEQMVARGSQLVWASGCMDCHTPGTLYGAPDTTRMLSGSEVGWQGPWGVSYPRNLTPDPETGIGSWTEDQIVTAFRTGHRPDGSPLLPPMPWPGLAHMSDDDAHAIAAYLKTLPPVNHKVPDVVPPGGKATGPVIVIPPPSAWDAPREAAPSSGS
jgi:mono/diheme cytochrome c family protein